MEDEDGKRHDVFVHGSQKAPITLVPLAIVFVIACAMTCGCASPSGSAEPAATARLEPVVIAGDEIADMVGTWRLESVDRTDGGETSAFFNRSEMDELEAMGLGGIMTLSPGGKASYDVIGKAGSGTWDESLLVTSDGRNLLVSPALGNRLSVVDGSLTYLFTRAS